MHDFIVIRYINNEFSSDLVAIHLQKWIGSVRIQFTSTQTEFTEFPLRLCETIDGLTVSLLFFCVRFCDIHIDIDMTLNLLHAETVCHL